MAGQYPFDQSGNGRPQQMSAAMRAALGLPQEDIVPVYLQQQQQQQQQRQEEAQRSYQLQRMILEEQLHEHQIRAIREHLAEFPDLQQRYQNLLLNEQLQRRTQEEAFLRDQAERQAVQQAAAAAELKRYQEEQLRLQQQQQLLSQQAAAGGISPNQSQLEATALRQAEVPKKKTRRKSISKGSEDSGSQAKRRASSMSESSAERKPRGRPRKNQKKSPPPSPEEDPAILALEKVALAADMATPQIVRRGTVEALLAAAEAEEKVNDIAGILKALKDIEWPDSDEEEYGLELPTQPAEAFSIPGFTSLLPKLPEEPLLDESLDEKEKKDSTTEGEDGEKAQEDKQAPTSKADGDQAKKLEADSVIKPTKISNVLEYPYPVDTWWPSITGVRRERRQAGETSDEDNFEEEPSIDCTTFRANERKIHNRLANSLEPGVLEKLPHCKIHRIKTKRKKNSTAPDLVYCWQLTEVYPNEIMVNCSVCGTWRHAACGGHYQPYSTRQNLQEPFVGVCENCHEEQKFLREYPKGEQRIERQRMEALRRGLATSAVMRHASFSKHGGTYKWPLGSVSATHIGGHTRSVHARHDKATKQWSDMATRLGRGYGYRPKERIKVRTKELERLLVSVEDAEGFTDRHNMLLFLTRDTAGDRPIGFESQRRNIFDPADDDSVLELDSEHGSIASKPSNGTKVASERDGSESNDQSSRSKTCARPGCPRKHRFDSLFCSDACGVLSVELDLLHTFDELRDIHPSVLRH